MKQKFISDSSHKRQPLGFGWLLTLCDIPVTLKHNFWFAVLNLFPVRADSSGLSDRWESTAGLLTYMALLLQWLLLNTKDLYITTQIR